MVQTLAMKFRQVIQCCMADWFLKPSTARIVVEMPINKIAVVAHIGIKKMVSYGRLSTSSKDSFLVNLPPTEAVSSMKPLAARPAED